MTASVVLVDVGNTRTKVAVAQPGAGVQIVLKDAEQNVCTWPAHLTRAGVEPPYQWAVCGVNRARVAELQTELTRRGEPCRFVRHHSEIPLAIDGPNRDQVGLDRLLDCLAATRRKHPAHPAVTLDAGTALVVNVVNAAGAFVGGGIMPGVRTLFQALHQAANLPRLDSTALTSPTWPGTTTHDAIQAGCGFALLGGIESMIAASAKLFTGPIDLFLTGGDARAIHTAARWPANCVPQLVETLTLEGLLHTVTDGG